MVRSGMARLLTTLLFLFWITGLSVAQQDLASRVLVVTGSKGLANYYMKKRGIPQANRCQVHAGGDSLFFDEYERKIAEPIRKCLETLGKDRILYIVLTEGVPYRMMKAPENYGRAVDSYIADIWGEASGSPRAMNPYFDPAIPRAGNYEPFISLAEYRERPGAKHVYSVWRLDAPSGSLEHDLIDKAMEAEKTGLSGQACFDRRMGDISKVKAPVYGQGEWDLYRAAQQLKQAGVSVLEDDNDAEFGHPPAPARCDDAIFYAGWYSLNHYNDAFSWKPGAIGFHLDSQSAMDTHTGPNWSAGALKRGITVTSGAVAEPTIWGLPHAGGVVHDLLAGANVGDAFFRNTLWVRWMIINIGDPLYRPKFLGTKNPQGGETPPPARDSGHPD